MGCIHASERKRKTVKTSIISVPEMKSLSFCSMWLYLNYFSIFKQLKQYEEGASFAPTSGDNGMLKTKVNMIKKQKFIIIQYVNGFKNISWCTLRKSWSNLKRIKVSCWCVQQWLKNNWSLCKSIFKKQP